MVQQQNTERLVNIKVTDYSDKVDILGELYANYRDDDNFKDFIEFNDLGLPLAYLSREGLCEVSDDGQRYILETWELFIKSLGLNDIGFNDLDEVLQASLDKEQLEGIHLPPSAAGVVDIRTIRTFGTSQTSKPHYERSFIFPEKTLRKISKNRWKF